MAIDRALAAGVLCVHLAWILWVLLGWTLTAHRRVLAWLHIGSLAYSILIEVAPLNCPLTLVEVYFERRAGSAAFQQSFLVHYAQAVIYPDVPPLLLTVVAVVVCAAMLTLHIVRFRRAIPPPPRRHS
jgi:Protein of Unknown function (DUF2784)